MPERDWEADRKLCEAATKGPWTHVKPYTTEVGWISRIDGAIRFTLASLTSQGEESRLDLKSAHANGEFIAESREGWPAALAEIATLQGILADMQQESTAYLQGRIDGDVEGRKLALAGLIAEVASDRSPFSGPYPPGGLRAFFQSYLHDKLGAIKQRVPASQAIATAKEEAKAEGKREGWNEALAAVLKAIDKTEELCLIAGSSIDAIQVIRNAVKQHAKLPPPRNPE